MFGATSASKTLVNNLARQASYSVSSSNTKRLPYGGRCRASVWRKAELISVRGGVTKILGERGYDFWAGTAMREVRSGTRAKIL